MGHYVQPVRHHGMISHGGWVIVGLALASWLGVMALVQIGLAILGS